MIKISKEKIEKRLKKYLPAELERLEKYRHLATDWDNEVAYKKAGFIEHPTWGWDKLRINAADGVIIKEQYFPDLENADSSVPYRIPTITCERVHNKRPISIQPLATIPEDAEKCEIADFFSDFVSSDSADLHSLNVAYYKGLPVLIDW